MRTTYLTVFWLFTFYGSILGQSMDHFIERGLENHPEIEKWSYWEESIKEEIEEEMAWPGPEIQMGYGLLPVETRVGPQIFRAGVTQPIKWPGLQNAKGDVVRKDLEIAGSRKSLSKREISYRIKNQYLSLYMIQKKKEYLEAFLKIYDDIRTDRVRQMEGGTGHYSDVLLIERSIEEIQRQIPQLEFQWNARKKELLYWSGMEEIDTVLITTIFPPFDPQKELVAPSFSDYPSIEVVKREEEKILQQMDLNDWMSYPQLMVGVDYIINAARQNVDIPDNGRDAIMPRIGVSLPFLSGKYSHADQKLEARALALDAQKQNEIARIDTELEVTRNKQLEAFDIFEMYDDLIKKTESIMDITRAQIGADHTRFAQFWDYQKEIVRYRLKQLEAHEELYRQKFIMEKYRNQ